MNTHKKTETEKAIERTLLNAMEISQTIWSKVLDSVDEATRERLQAYDALQGTIVLVQSNPSDAVALFSLTAEIHNAAKLIEAMEEEARS